MALIMIPRGGKTLEDDEENVAFGKENFFLIDFLITEMKTAKELLLNNLASRPQKVENTRTGSDDK